MAEKEGVTEKTRVRQNGRPKNAPALSALAPSMALGRRLHGEAARRARHTDVPSESLHLSINLETTERWFFHLCGDGG